MFLVITSSVLCLILVFKLFTVITCRCRKVNVSLNGRTALVTGGNSGLGYETSLFLASHGCRVIVADVIDSTETVNRIIALTNNPEVLYEYLDLSSFASVRRFAAIFSLNEQRLDILINNAGCAGYKCKTDDGIYKVLQVNHLGHFLLTQLLSRELSGEFPLGANLIFTSVLAFANNLHIANGINYSVEWRIPILSEVFDYGNSKACILATTAIFAQKWARYGIVVSACHPGMVQTEIYRKSFANCGVRQKKFAFLIGSVVGLVVTVFGKTRIQGIQSILHCALARNTQSEDFIMDCKRILKPWRIYDPRFCNYIWEESLRLVALRTDEIQHSLHSSH